MNPTNLQNDNLKQENALADEFLEARQHPSDPGLDGQGLPDLRFRIFMVVVGCAVLFVAGLHYGIINP